MTRYIAVCPRCNYEMDFAQTKIRPGDIKNCINCRLDSKVVSLNTEEEDLENDEGTIRAEVTPHITLGVEIESYLIRDNKIIELESVKPLAGAIEEGETFDRDITIGNEYISRIFTDISEGLFLLKNGLRKYLKFSQTRGKRQIGLFGMWHTKSAGSHIHVALGEDGIKKEDAIPLSAYIHDYLPFLLAVNANSPIHKEKFTKNDSTRIIKYGNTHSRPIKKEDIKKKDDHWTEINYNAVRSNKPPTVEIRILDSNIPEYIMAPVAMVKVLTIAYIRGTPKANELDFQKYKRSRWSAAKYGVKGSLHWNGRNIKFQTYLDNFFNVYHEEIEECNIPDEILNVFRLAKIGWNHARILEKGLKTAKSLYGSKKFNWRKQFIELYSKALESLLDGAKLDDYARMLNVELPEIDGVRLGKKHRI